MTVQSYVEFVDEGTRSWNEQLSINLLIYDNDFVTSLKLRSLDKSLCIKEEFIGISNCKYFLNLFVKRFQAFETGIQSSSSIMQSETSNFGHQLTNSAYGIVRTGVYTMFRSSFQTNCRRIRQYIIGALQECTASENQQMSQNTRKTFLPLLQARMTLEKYYLQLYFSLSHQL